MTRDPLVLTRNIRAREALALLQENRIRHVPVVENGRLLGIVTERDLLRALPGSIAEVEVRADVDPLLSQVMTPDPVTIDPNAHVVDAAKILLERRFHCLPVVSDGRLIGILTATDVFEVFTRAFTRPTGRRVTLLSPPGSELEDGFDIAAEAGRLGLSIESLVQQDFPGGGLVTELYVVGEEGEVKRFFDRSGDAGYAILDDSGAKRRSV